jgi:hypothetical protein
MRYRTPEVDDLEASAKEGRNFCWWEVQMNASNGERRSLVHMDQWNWLTFLRAMIIFPWAMAANSYDMN